MEDEPDLFLVRVSPKEAHSRKYLDFEMCKQLTEVLCVPSRMPLRLCEADYRSKALTLVEAK